MRSTPTTKSGRNTTDKVTTKELKEANFVLARLNEQLKAKVDKQADIIDDLVRKLGIMVEVAGDYQDHLKHKRDWR